jgi:hypothetical protein
MTEFSFQPKTAEYFSGFRTRELPNGRFLHLGANVDEAYMHELYKADPVMFDNSREGFCTMTPFGTAVALVLNLVAPKLGEFGDVDQQLLSPVSIFRGREIITPLGIEKADVVLKNIHLDRPNAGVAIVSEGNPASFVVEEVDGVLRAHRVLNSAPLRNDELVAADTFSTLNMNLTTRVTDLQLRKRLIAAVGPAVLKPGTQIYDALIGLMERNGLKVNPKNVSFTTSKDRWGYEQI